MKENPNITSDCGRFSGFEALDGYGRSIVIVSGPSSPICLNFNGKRFDYSYTDMLTGTLCYLDHSDPGIDPNEGIPTPPLESELE